MPGSGLGQEPVSEGSYDWMSRIPRWVGNVLAAECEERRREVEVPGNGVSLLTRSHAAHGLS